MNGLVRDTIKANRRIIKRLCERTGLLWGYAPGVSREHVPVTTLHSIFNFYLVQCIVSSLIYIYIHFGSAKFVDQSII